jgi:hypothetical protein
VCGVLTTISAGTGCVGTGIGVDMVGIGIGIGAGHVSAGTLVLSSVVLLLTPAIPPMRSGS